MDKSQLKEAYYYFRDNNTGEPKVTICIVQAPDKTCARGITICSDEDALVKKEGRRFARKRAYSALGKKRTDESSIIDMRGSEGKILRRTCWNVNDINYKEEFSPSLTAFEEWVITKKKTNAEIAEIRCQRKLFEESIREEMIARKKGDKKDG